MDVKGRKDEGKRQEGEGDSLIYYLSRDSRVPGLMSFDKDFDSKKCTEVKWTTVRATIGGHTCRIEKHSGSSFFIPRLSFITSKSIKANTSRETNGEFDPCFSNSRSC